jgi:hypothetical protein
MKAPTESSDLLSYVCAPFESVFLRRRDQILELVNVTSYALQSMRGASRLLGVLKESPEQVASVKKIEEKALAEIYADMPLLHGSAVVLIWGALEASFRDFLIRWLERNPSARLAPDLKSIRVRLVEYESFSGEDRMRYLLGILERELAAALRPGIGRFECLLKPFGIDVVVADTVRRDLNELAAVRNVIVHRASVADSRFVELCPWLRLDVGDEVRVSSDTFVRYVKAASEYTACLITEVSRMSGQGNAGPLPGPA